MVINNVVMFLRNNLDASSLRDISPHHSMASQLGVERLDVLPVEARREVLDAEEGVEGGVELALDVLRQDCLFAFMVKKGVP